MLKVLQTMTNSVLEGQNNNLPFKMKIFIAKSEVVAKYQSSMDTWMQNLCVQFLTEREGMFVLFQTTTSPCLCCSSVTSRWLPHTQLLCNSPGPHFFSDVPSTVFRLIWRNLVLEKDISKFTSFSKAKLMLCILISKIHLRSLSTASISDFCQ